MLSNDPTLSDSPQQDVHSSEGQVHHQYIAAERKTKWFLTNPYVRVGIVVACVGGLLKNYIASGFVTEGSLYGALLFVNLIPSLLFFAFVFIQKRKNPSLPGLVDVMLYFFSGYFISELFSVWQGAYYVTQWLPIDFYPQAKGPVVSCVLFVINAVIHFTFDVGLRIEMTRFLAGAFHTRPKSVGGERTHSLMGVTLVTVATSIGFVTLAVSKASQSVYTKYAIFLQIDGYNAELAKEFGLPDYTMCATWLEFFQIMMFGTTVHIICGFVMGIRLATRVIRSEACDTMYSYLIVVWPTFLITLTVLVIELTYSRMMLFFFSTEPMLQLTLPITFPRKDPATSTGILIGVRVVEVLVFLGVAFYQYKRCSAEVALVEAQTTPDEK